MREHPAKGGVYRNTTLMVQPDDKAGDTKKLLELVEERFGKKAIPIFISACNKYNIHSNNEDTFNSFTNKEREIWDSIFYTAPCPTKVPTLMHKFALEYRKVLQEDHHPIARAAWVHMQVVNIHAFEDGSGREARIMMNAELKRGGYASIVFFDDQAYTKAIEEDHKRPGAFAEYLAKAYSVSLPLGEVQKFPDLI